MANCPTTDRSFYVYGLFRPDDGRIFYVGMGRGNRAWRHISQRKLSKSHKNNLICKLVDRLGYPEIPIVIMREGLTRQQAVDLEIALIFAIGRHPHGPLTNVTKGGEGLADPTLETRDLIRAKAIGRLFSVKTRRLMSEKAKARDRTGEWEQRRLAAINTPEANAKRSAKMKGRPSSNKGKKASEELRAKLSAAHKGLKISEETRIKMSAARKGRKHTEESRAKLSAALKGRSKTPEAIARISAAKKGRVWITNGALSRVVDPATIPDGWRRGRA